jgi:hypothetical protein
MRRRTPGPVSWLAEEGCMEDNLARAAGLRAQAVENRTFARMISWRPDREALLRTAEELEAAAGRIERETASVSGRLPGAYALTRSWQSHPA